MCTLAFFPSTHVRLIVFGRYYEALSPFVLQWGYVELVNERCLSSSWVQLKLLGLLGGVEAVLNTFHGLVEA